jgi:hypothetical protein
MLLPTLRWTVITDILSLDPAMVIVKAAALIVGGLACARSAA